MLTATVCDDYLENLSFKARRRSARMSCEFTQIDFMQCQMDNDRQTNETTII